MMDVLEYNVAFFFSVKSSVLLLYRISSSALDMGYS